MKTVFTSNYSVITFATGKIKYTKFALNCARSVLQFNKIRFYIVSDLRFEIPIKLKEHVFIIKAIPEHLDKGTGIKLYIDKYLQTRYTLFIDSDCLCYSSLQPAFNLFSDKSVSVAGNVVNTANWCGEEQAKTIYETFGITQLSRFNGGIYYILRSEKSTKIFNKAREIALDYDRLGFNRIHENWINEEIPISIAITLHQELSVADDGFLMTDLYTDQHTSKLNVLTGFRHINNPSAGSAWHRPWYPNQILKPLIVHFGNSNLYRYPYLSQHVLLKLSSNHIPAFLASFLTIVFIHVPFKLKYWLFSQLQNRLG